MAIHAYNKFYVEKAQKNLAVFFDFGVNFIGENIDELYLKFITFGIAELFGKGDPKIVGGIDGIELYYLVTNSKEKYEDYQGYYSFSRSPEYWLGYYLAYAQWYLNTSFRDISSVIEASELLSWYETDHEADVLRFTEKIEKLLLSNYSSLKNIRNRANLTQSELADISGVSIRNIQLYEQGVNDIRNSQYNFLSSLASTLNCAIEDIVDFFPLKEELLDNLDLYYLKFNEKKYNLSIKYKHILTEYINRLPFSKIGVMDNLYFISKEVFINYYLKFWTLTFSSMQMEINEDIKKLIDEKSNSIFKLYKKELFNFSIMTFINNAFDMLKIVDIYSSLKEEIKNITKSRLDLK